MLPSLLAPGNRPKHTYLVPNMAELCADLGLGAVLDAMAGLESAQGGPTRQNTAIRDSSLKVMFETPAASGAAIAYRQGVAKDALGSPDKFLGLFEALEDGCARYEDARLRSQPGYARVATVSSRLRTASELMELVFTLAESVRGRLSSLAAGVSSGGMAGYISAFTSFYSAGFIQEALKAAAAVARIKEGSEVTLGAKLGLGLKGTGYAIRGVGQQNKTARAFGRKKTVIGLDTDSLQFKSAELRDAAAARVLAVANAVVAQTADDLRALLSELGFYVGCIQLHGKLAATGARACFPELFPMQGEMQYPASSGGTPNPTGPGGTPNPTGPGGADRPANSGETPYPTGPGESPPPAADVLSFRNLADISLALNCGAAPVTNSLDLDGVRLAVVTGANQGGKSTFLRSLGCAQIMAQCGLFVAADEFRFCVRPRVFTHFCKPEDATMDSGKLDEELARLDGMVDKLAPGALMLMNESFSSTAEHEGAALAREVVGAMCGLGVKVAYVTHLYEYARSLETENRPVAGPPQPGAGQPRTDTMPPQPVAGPPQPVADQPHYGTVLLRAERRDDGSRTFAIKPGLTLPTSYGMDLFREIISRD